jgi:Outer membrane protein/protective antigen OMA87
MMKVLGLAVSVLLLCGLAGARAVAQSAAGEGTAELREVNSEGQKMLTEAQIVALSGLQTGTQVGRAELQAGANKLVGSGLFATVRYDFKTRNDGVTLTFHVAESPQLPAYYDNFPWFGDSELNDAIRARLPFFNGTLPEGGSVVDEAAEAIRGLLASHELGYAVQHAVTANPLGEGNLQQFSVEGTALKIASLNFSDAALATNSGVQQHLSEIVGKPYSRTAIDVFLAEQIRPVYWKQGYLQVKLGPPEVRLSGPPSAKLPEELPVFVPVSAGAVYRFAGAAWNGNNVLSSISLESFLGLKAGAVADGMEFEGGLEKVRDEYGRRGYLDATVQPLTSFNEAARTVSYKIAVSEGTQYHMGGWVITGLSTNGEQRVRTMFPIASGDIFDKMKYQDFLIALQNHSKEILGELPIHYETVGHWLKPDAEQKTVDVLLDFK